MATPITITRGEEDVVGLCRAARRARNPAAVRRVLALAIVIEDALHTEAAQAGGMDRQTPRDRDQRMR